MFHLRRADTHDHPALAAICIATGDHGGDARSLYADPQLLADIYVLPYAVVEPDWCWVAEDGGGVAGYLVATPDTLDFARRTEAQWWPALRRRHPLPDPDDGRAQAQLVRRLHAGTLTELPFLATHPAHLHIDLLPRAQRQGVGRRLMATLQQSLDAAGVNGLHLAVSARNPGAIALYERLGFAVLQRGDWGQWMGRHTG
ncbi:MAG TPA: GNAT family N-acetyltransferase [Albitalea sp.]|jgi:ribosomal protein S18 acetylase RimI-like enzyme|nr:GNAT family N-acetyltransferase [Albitalea sp.]